MMQPLWRTVWQFLIKLNMILPCDPSIAFLDVCPKVLVPQSHLTLCDAMELPGSSIHGILQMRILE